MKRVLPTRELSLMLQAKLRDFSQGLNNPELVIDHTYRKCNNLVRAYLTDEVASRMKWLPLVAAEKIITEEGDILYPAKFDPKLFDTKAYIGSALVRIFPWLDITYLSPNFEPQTKHEEDVYQLVDFINSQIIDPMWLAVMQMVEEQIPNRTWKIYSIEELGRDIVVVEDVDYRIWDWYRKVKL